MIDCEVWWAKPVPEPGEFLALLTAAERERYQAYRQEADRRRFLTGRALAKTLAAERLEATPADIEFDATCSDCGKQHGPPRIPGADLKLSISHSGERVGLALTNGPEVGLDVESAGRHADDSLAGYALNDTEREAIATLGAEARAGAFFTYWTRKEAVMKATGRGLRIPLRSITMSAHDQAAQLVASEDPALTPDGTRMADLDPGDGYRAAVAVLTAGELTITEQWWKPGS